MAGRQPYAGQRPRPPAARGVLRRRGHDDRRLEPDHPDAPLPARSACRTLRTGRAAALHAGHGPAARRPRPHPDGSDASARRRARGDDSSPGARGGAWDGRPGAAAREDVGRRSQRHLPEARAGRLPGDHRRGACRQDAGARARHPAGRSEGGRRRRRRRARAHGAAPTPRRRVPRAREGETTVLGHP